MEEMSESEYYLRKWLRRIPLLAAITIPGMALVFAYYDTLAALPWLSQFQTFTLITSIVLVWTLMESYYKTKRRDILAATTVISLAVHIGVMTLAYQVREAWPIMLLCAVAYAESMAASVVLMKFGIYPRARRTFRR